MQLTRDGLYKVVCMIRTPSNGLIGTGCFIEKNNHLYLITAEHVKNGIFQDSELVFGESNSENHIILLNSLIKGNWYTHNIADLAAIEFDQNRLNSLFSERFLSYNQCLLNSNMISRDRELTVVGFPYGLGTCFSGSSKFCPLSFRSFASSSFMSMERADRRSLCDFFCLENPAMGGYSGGPVFDLGYIKTPVMTQSYGETMLLGFIHGTMCDKTGGKLALVTPSYYLNELIP